MTPPLESSFRFSRAARTGSACRCARPRRCTLSRRHRPRAPAASRCRASAAPLALGRPAFPGASHSCISCLHFLLPPFPSSASRSAGPHFWRAGHPISARACAHASLVAAIFSVKISSKASVMLSGGPPSMMLRSGMPWLSSRERERGRERLT